MPTALITGAGKRIGAAIARALAADGWAVLAHYHRSAAEAEDLATEIRAGGGVCATVQADLLDRDAVAALIPACTERHGRIDCLINNASSFRFDSVKSASWASWDEGLRANLESPVFLAQAFAHALGDASGNIVNIIDHKIAALNPDFFSYTVAKIGLAGATRLMAMAFAARPQGRIRVNGIAPGLTLPSTKQTQEQFDRAWRNTPLGLSSTPEELADAVRLILATPSLNGEILLLDGGDHLVPRGRDVSLDPGLR
jgi:NAD(P)-dependent dehydrogenase (short-subunit alcohol dehydrogenase family)